jgi:ATP-dependent protease ClpP protease subunit
MNVNYTSIAWGGDIADGIIKDGIVRSNNNEIFFSGGVTASSINSLLTELDAVISKVAKAQTTLIQNTNNSLVEVILYIDSPGGSVKDCFKFVDHIDILKKNHNLHLTTVCNGITASAGTLMALVGDKRYITRHSIYMIHELFGHSIGTFTHITSRIKHINMLHDNIVELYVKYVPGLDREHLLKLLQTEGWFSAIECQNMGFAEII